MLHNVLPARYRHGSLPQKPVRSRAGRCIGIARHGEHIAVLLQRVIGRYQRAAARGRFHHDHAETEAGDDAVALFEIPRHRAHTRRVFAHERTRDGALIEDRAARFGIDLIHRRAQNADHRSAGAQCPLHRGTVHPGSHAGHHRAAKLGDLVAETKRHFRAVGRGFARSHHRDAGHVIHWRQLSANI